MAPWLIGGDNGVVCVKLTVRVLLHARPTVVAVCCEMGAYGYAISQHTATLYAAFYPMIIIHMRSVSRLQSTHESRPPIRLARSHTTTPDTTVRNLGSLHSPTRRDRPRRHRPVALLTSIDLSLSSFRPRVMGTACLGTPSPRAPPSAAPAALVAPRSAAGAASPQAAAAASASSPSPTRCRCPSVTRSCCQNRLTAPGSLAVVFPRPPPPPRLCCAGRR